MDLKFERPKESSVLKKIIYACNLSVRWIIYILVFLVPLFFLPDTVDIFDYNKQFLIWTLTALAAFIWWFRMIILEKKFVWKRTPFDIPILIFLAINILIALFSIDRHLSFWGDYGTYAQGVVNLIFMIMLFFVVTNNL